MPESIPLLESAKAKLTTLVDEMVASLDASDFAAADLHAAAIEAELLAVAMGLPAVPVEYLSFRRQPPEFDHPLLESHPEWYSVEFLRINSFNGVEFVEFPIGASKADPADLKAVVLLPAPSPQKLRSGQKLLASWKRHVSNLTPGCISPEEAARAQASPRRQAIRALMGMADNPRIAQWADDGRPKIERFTVDSLRGRVSEVATFVNNVKSGEDECALRHISPPLDVVKDLFSRPDASFPKLANVVEAPVLKPDGSLLCQPGYDADTRLFFASDGTPGVSIPTRPTQAQAIEAARFVDTELLRDFPFVDQASRANALGMLLSPLVRTMVEGCTPMAVVNATAAGWARMRCPSTAHG